MEDRLPHPTILLLFVAFVVVIIIAIHFFSLFFFPLRPASTSPCSRDAFLSQLLTFDDAELERLYLFARYLKRYLPVDRESLPREVENHFDEMAESNFKLLERIVDDRQFGEALVDRLFERFWRVMREGEGAD